MLWHVCVFLHLLFSHKDSFELEFWIWIRVRSQSTLNLMEFSLRTLDKEALVDLSSLNNVIISPYILSKWWMLLYSRGQLKDCCIWLVKKKFQEADCGSAVSDGRQQCMRKTAKSMTRWHKRMVAGRIDWYTELECQRLERLYKEGQEESVPVKCGKTKRTSSLPWWRRWRKTCRFKSASCIKAVILVCAQEPFVQACASFLVVRCPQLVGKDDQATQSKSHQLPAETIGTMLACLQACCTYVVSMIVL